jgi:hypothetical protein
VAARTAVGVLPGACRRRRRPAKPVRPLVPYGYVVKINYLRNVGFKSHEKMSKIAGMEEEYLYFLDQIRDRIRNF